MQEKTFYEANQQLWDQRVDGHVESDFYRMDAFLAGWNSLDAFSVEFLGDIRDKSILHVQCHFGQDTISMSRMGGRVTGLDFSSKAINKGNALAAELGLDTQFVLASVYEMDQHLSQQYDIVFTSYGCIVWLPDLNRWACQLRKRLKPGGRLILVDFHPFLMMYDFPKKKMIFDYFNRSVIHEQVQKSYVDSSSSKEGEVMDEYSWSHTISEIFTACNSNGLRLKRFEEYDYAPYPIFPVGNSERDRHYQFISEPSFPHCMAMEFVAE